MAKNESMSHYAEWAVKAMEAINEAIRSFCEAITELWQPVFDRLLRWWYGMPWMVKEALLRMQGYSEADLKDCRSQHYWGRVRLSRRDLWLSIK